ncbi:MAG TPA: hypothetical protein VFL96_12045, partial [Acidobacteriaceae bacterium]|nr:hypothetical protein [Acidobacteriaceae bacterium]
EERRPERRQPQGVGILAKLKTPARGFVLRIAEPRLKPHSGWSGCYTPCAYKSDLLVRLN